MLPNITEICFSLQDRIFSLKKETKSDSKIFSIQRIENSKISEEKFYCFKAPDKKIHNTYSNEDSVIKITVAIPYDINKAIDFPLYTFFPIETTKTPFNAILHATFLLAENRESIRND